MRLAKKFQKPTPIRNDWKLVGVKNLAWCRQLIREGCAQELATPKPGFSFRILVLPEQQPKFHKLKKLAETYPQLAQVGPCRFSITYVGEGHIVDGPEGLLYSIDFRVVGKPDDPVGKPDGPKKA